MIILSVVATDRKTIRSDTTMLPLLVSSDSIRQVNIPIVFFCMLVQCCVVTFFPPEKKTNKQTNKCEQKGNEENNSECMAMAVVMTTMLLYISLKYIRFQNSLLRPFFLFFWLRESDPIIKNSSHRESIMKNN